MPVRKTPTPKAPARKRANTPPFAKAPTPPPAKQSPVRHMRIPDPVWDPFVEKCERDGYGVSERVRQLIRDDVKGG